jgi:hypothetical protein
MKKLIMESLLVFAMLVFVASSAMAEKPEDIMGNSNVLPSGKKYALNITGKSGNDKEATTITELQTDASSPSNIDGHEAYMEQLRMIMILLFAYNDSITLSYF